MNIRSKLTPWFEARKRHKLSAVHVQMARELGMNPKKLGKLDNHRQQPWKASLPEFIEQCYLKRFGIESPREIRSLEEVVKSYERNRALKKARKLERKIQENGVKKVGDMHEVRSE